jgi:hypothetical protein
MAISQEHPEGFDLRGKSNPIAPFEMASGLLQVSSLAWKNASLGRTSAFIGMGRRRTKAFTDSVPIGTFALAKRR